MKFKILLLFVHTLNSLFTVLELQLHFLQRSFQLNKLCMRVDVGFLRLLVAIDPDLTGVFLRDDLLLKLQNFIRHLFPLDLVLLFNCFLLDLETGEVAF